MAIPRNLSILAQGASASGVLSVTYGGTGVTTSTGTGSVVLSNSPSLTSPAVGSGNLTFSTTGQRITGDFSNATASNRVSFQTSTTNGGTAVNVLPNGTSTTTNLLLYNAADPANASIMQVRSSGDGGLHGIQSTTSGSGTLLPLKFFIGGGEKMQIDTSGNVGIGTASPSEKLSVHSAIGVRGSNFASTTYVGSSVNTTGVYTGLDSAGGFATNVRDAGYLTYSTNNTERMRIDSSGNVGIGTSSPSQKFHVSGSGSTYTRVSSSNAGSGAGSYFANATSTWLIGAGPASGGSEFAFVDQTSGSLERMRIDSSGTLLVGGTGINNANTFAAKASDGSCFSSIASGVNTYHVWSSSSSSYRFYVNENGGISNFSGNNVNLSDERTKKNIELSGSYLNKICAIPVKMFNYKDEKDGEQKTLGLIAQDVEAVAPELVSNDGWEGVSAEDGLPLKSIYTTDVMFALMKSIQELKTQNDELKARVAALEGKA